MVWVFSIDRFSARPGDVQLRFRRRGVAHAACLRGQRHPAAAATPAVSGACAMTAASTVKRRMAEGSLMRAVMETVIDGLITIDEQGVVNSFNRAAERIFGYRSEEVIGENIKILMPEPYHSNHGDFLANYRRTGDAKVIGIGREVIARRKDGTTLPIELGVSETWVGRRRMFVGTIRDITDRKEREASEVFLRNLLDTIVDGLMTIDESGTVLSVNPAARRLFGYCESEMLGCDVRTLIPEPYRSRPW